MKHVLGIRNMEVDEIVDLVGLAKDFKEKVLSRSEVPQLGKRVVGMLFFENSTRTRVSFEQAAYYLGLKTSNFSSGGSSLSKGETLKDTILTLRYERLDGLVMRHKSSGSAALAARHFGGPVVNAGDGRHEHPTQALGDALTILERKGTLKGLRVAIVGDVEHSRVARSNAWLLSKMGAEVRFVGPRVLVPAHASLLPGEVFYDLATGIADADVVMCLRLQRERMNEGMYGSIGEYAAMYQVNSTSIHYAKEDCLVMHPGPLNRGIEVDDDAADGLNSVITAQIENGIFARMACLYRAFGDDEAPSSPEPTPAEASV